MDELAREYFHRETQITRTRWMIERDHHDLRHEEAWKSLDSGKEGRFLLPIFIYYAKSNFAVR